ncbi:MAG: hypothetical protein LBL76_08245 [Treponema sp.]|nr:hypothetical protein [Treponema sp.]
MKVSNYSKSAKKPFFSPPVLFILYMLVSGMVIMGWQFLVPGELPPLPIYARFWYLSQGFLVFFSLFPALTMAGFIIPYGLFANSRQEGRSFGSLKFFQGPLKIAIGATVVYGILFFLVSPLIRDLEDNLRSQGQIFTLSKEKAQIHAAMDAWPQVAQHIIICERIWPNSPEIEQLKMEMAIQLEARQVAEIEARMKATAKSKETNPVYTGPLFQQSPQQRQPVNAAEALTMGTLSFEKERYFDAHWLGVLASRIAPQGSPVYIQGLAIANRSWDILGQLAPDAQDRQAYALYHQKRTGYEAMVAGNWIQAYYVFKELFDKTPGDPDVTKFLALSTQGLQDQAFFTDEIDSVVENALTDTMFSFPVTGTAGRVVVRIPWLFTDETHSYGLDLELMALDEEGSLLYQVTAPYVKLFPIDSGARSQLVLMMHALDRSELTRQYQPIWTGQDQSHAGDTQLILDIRYTDFLFLSQVRQGLDSLSMRELVAAVKTIGSYGHIPQVFQAEIVYRLSIPAVFLPISILSLIIGWKYRSRRQSLYLVPMLAILPLICNWIVVFYRNMLNILSVWSVISFGFLVSLGLFTLGLMVMLVCSLIFLATQ